MNEIKINPEFQNLMPALTIEEYKGLEKSIILEGCRDAIILWNNYIIDGHYRLKICHENDIEFSVISKDKDFHNIEEIKEWIILNQFCRRNNKRDKGNFDSTVR